MACFLSVPLRFPIHRHTVHACAQRQVDPLATSSLGPPQVLCAGEALLNLFCSNTSTSPWAVTPGGASANLAATLAKLGVSSAFLGSVGEDSYGKEVVKEFEKLGVNVDAVRIVKGRKTRGVYVHHDRGERRFVRFNGKNEEFADTVGIDMDTMPAVLFYAAKILAVGTAALAFNERRMKELVSIARECLLQIVVDLNWRGLFWKGREEEAKQVIKGFVRDADLIKASLEDVSFLYGADFAKRAFEQPQLLRERLDGRCSNFIVTAGEKGATYMFGDITGHVHAIVPENGVIDTTGAGDAFLGAFLAEMLKLGGMAALTDERKCERMAKFATAAAACVVGAVGGMGGRFTRADVEHLMQAKQLV